MLTNGAILKARISIPIVFCGLIVCWSFQALGEELTEAQKEVWSVIETRWEGLKQGDYKAVEATTHEDALIWWNDREGPMQKSLIMHGYINWITYANARPATYELNPLAIQLFGDIANVFFFYKWKGEGKWSGHSRALVSLKKENGKWLIISSISSSCEKLPLCLD